MFLFYCSIQVSEEFYRQGDLERRLGLAVTPLCDRQSSSVSQIQTGFFKFIAAPLFEEWHRFHSTRLSSTMLDYLRSNKVHWRYMFINSFRFDSTQKECTNSWLNLNSNDELKICYEDLIELDQFVQSNS